MIFIKVCKFSSNFIVSLMEDTKFSSLGDFFHKEEFYLLKDKNQNLGLDNAQDLGGYR